MDRQLKPANIPNELVKRHLFIWMLSVLAIWFALVVLIVVVPMSDRMLILLTGLWMLSFLVTLMLPLLFDRVLFPEGVQIRLLGKVIRQIPLSEIKLICAVGDDQAQYLCLSLWDLEELAGQRERVLQRGIFSRQDLTFLKRKPDWQERLAREYLLNPKGLPLWAPVLWIHVDPVVVIFLRRLYPNLPYADLRSRMSGQICVNLPDQIPFSGERFRIDEQGVHIFAEIRRTEQRCFSAEQIKTILRVDMFADGSRTGQGYNTYLVISELPLDVLAARNSGKAGKKWKKRIIDQLPEAEELYAAEFYFSGVWTWDSKTATGVPVPYTPQTETLLRTLFPHARWVDYSGKWQ